MAISSSDKVTVSANSTSDWVALSVGSNLISVTSPTWGGSTQAALQMSYDAQDATAAAVDMDGSNVVFTQNRYRTIDGPGYVRIVVTDISGPVELKRVSAR